MLRSLHTAATGMNAQELKMNVISNNLANTSTTGFKNGRAEFEDLLSERLRSAEAPDPRGGTSPTALEVGLGVRAGATTRNFGQGDLINTGNPLDLAIEGHGFFQVSRPNGNLAYTRAGNFMVDAQGRLVTQNGHLIEPSIEIPEDATTIEMRQDGTILARVPNRTDPVEVGNIELVLFPNPGGLHAIGNNLMEASTAAGQPRLTRPGEEGAGQITQGFLEGANVKAVEEMIGLITTQRSYEMNSKVIQTADQMLQRLSQMR